MNCACLQKPFSQPKMKRKNKEPSAKTNLVVSCAKKMTKHLSGTMATPKKTAAPPSWKKYPESMSLPCSSSRNKVSALLYPTQSCSIDTNFTQFGS